MLENTMHSLKPNIEYENTVQIPVENIRGTRCCDSIPGRLHTHYIKDIRVMFHWEQNERKETDRKTLMT